MVPASATASVMTANQGGKRERERRQIVHDLICLPEDGGQKAESEQHADHAAHDARDTAVDHIFRHDAPVV